MAFASSTGKCGNKDCCEVIRGDKDIEGNKIEWTLFFSISVLPSTIEIFANLNSFCHGLIKFTPHHNHEVVQML